MGEKLSKELYTELMASVTDKVKEEMKPSIEKSLVIGLVEESIHSRYKETKDLKDFPEETNKRSSEDINIKESEGKQVDHMELGEDKLKGNWVHVGKANEISKTPLTKREIIASTIREQASSWLNSNDIKSPSHLVNISEVVSGLQFDSNFTEVEGRSLKNNLIDLYHFISNIISIYE